MIKKIKDISRGFTLVELLIAIAIIGIMAGLTFTVINPSSQRAKAEDTVKLSNLEKLVMGIGAFYEAEGRYPTINEVTSFSNGTNNLLSTYLKVWPGAEYIYNINNGVYSVYVPKSADNGYLAYTSSFNSSDIADCTDLTGASCQIGSGSGSVTIIAVLPQSLSLEFSPSSIDITESSSFSATLTYSNGNTKDVTNLVTWGVDSGSLLGLSFTPTAVGTVNVNASYSESGVNLTAGGQLAVSTRFDSFVISPNPFELQKQEVKSVTIYEKNTAGVLTDVTASVTNWVNSNSANAIMISHATFRGDTPGTTNISFTYNGVSGSFGITVLEPVLTSLAITTNTGIMKVYPPSTLPLIATANYSDGSKADVTNLATWSSSNSSSATVSNTGVVTGLLADSSSTITATYNGVSGNSAITIPAISSLTVTAPSNRIFAGTSLQFNANIKYADNTSKSVNNAASWSSSNTACHTVQKGLVKAEAVCATTSKINIAYLGRTTGVGSIYAVGCSTNSNCSALSCSGGVSSKCDLNTKFCYCP